MDNKCMAVVDPLCDGLVMSLFSFFIYLMEKMLGYSIAWSFKYEAPQFSYATSQQTFSSFLNVTHSGNFFMVNDELHGRETMRTDWFALFYDLLLIKADVGWYGESDELHGIPSTTEQPSATFLKQL
ncbi:hypothetical protein Dimus_030230 [Dionaea muscipula]